MAIYESTDSLQLANLIQAVDEGRMALPDFQRSYVWKPAQVEELLASICQDFPVGTILRVRNGEKLKLGELRVFEGAPTVAVQPDDIEYVVLDGQQRLTSLYTAFSGSGSHRYFLNLKSFRESGEISESITSSHHTRQPARDLRDPDHQYERLMLPFSEFGRFPEWSKLARRYWQKEYGPDDVNQLEDFLQEVGQEVVDLALHYRIPVLTLSRDVTLNAVCTIFETINRTGTRLSLFDLLTARFRIDNIFLRDEWDRARTEHPELEEFDVDPFHLLRAIAAIVSRGHTVKRQDVLDLNGEDFRLFWNSVVREMAWVLQVFKDDCGLASPRWMPYDPMVVAPTAALVDFGSIEHSMRGAIRDKLRRWFFASAFSSTYEHGATSRIAHDFKELSSWFSTSDAPAWIDGFELDPQALEDAVSLQSATYKATLCYYLMQGPRDFSSGEPITRSVLRAKDVEDHHVFPKAYVKKQYGDHAPYDENIVLNRVLISRETNRRIGSRRPSVYMASIRDQLKANGAQSSGFDVVLQSHILPPIDSDAFRNDAFSRFIEDRRGRVIAGIQRLVREDASPAVADERTPILAS